MPRKFYPRRREKYETIRADVRFNGVIHKLYWQFLHIFGKAKNFADYNRVCKFSILCLTYLTETTNINGGIGIL